MVEIVPTEELQNLPSPSAESPVLRRKLTRREEEVKVQALWEMFNVAARDRSKFDADWNKYYRRYRHDHWRNRRLQDWKATPVYNKVFSNIESITPLITDHRVEPLILPRTEKDAPLQEPLQRTFDYILESNRIEMVNQNVARGAEIYGSWFYKVSWDQDLAEGRGDILIEDVSCRQVFPAPGYREVEDMPWLIVAKVIDEAELRREFGDQIDIETIDEGVIGKNSDELQNEAGASRHAPHDAASNQRAYTGVSADPSLTTVTNVAGKAALERPDGIDIGIPTKKYTHLEIWIKDDTADENGEPLFPEGRVIDVVNNRIVRDQPNLLGFIPYVKYDAYSVPEQFFGQGTAEVVWPLQQTLNKILGQMIDHTNLSVNPPIKKSWNAVPEAFEGKIFSYPGALLPVMDMAGLEYMQVPRVDSNTFALISLVEQMMDTVTGIFEVTQGRRPKNVESAQAVALIQEGSQTRIRQKTRNMDDAAYKVYLRVLKLIKRFYTSERIIAFFDDEGNATQMNINTSLATQDIAQTTVPEGLTPLDENTSQFSEFTPGQSFVSEVGDVVQPVHAGGGIIQWLTNPVDRADFDIHVIPGSSLPVEQRIRQDTAIRLGQMVDRDGYPILDREGLLDEIQWPKKDQIIGRINERKQQDMQIQQLMQAVEQLQAQGGPAQPQNTAVGGQGVSEVQLPVPQV